MEYRIETIQEKKLVGKRTYMSLSDEKTHDLWHSFMSEKMKIKNTIASDLYSMQIYDPYYFDNFSPGNEFEKLAAIEVADFDTIPDEMEKIILPGGLYAVFLHQGAASTGPKTFQYIFETWLPGSGYILDDRPHFEILGEKYKNDDPASEEEIWIPIKLKI